MKTKIVLLVGAVGLIASAFNACSQPENSSSNSSIAASTSPTNQNSLVGKVAMSVIDPSNNSTVYSDAVANSSLLLKAAKTYKLILSVNQAPAGTSATFSCKLTSSSTGGTFNQVLNVGANTISVPNMGDYSCALTTNAAGYSPVTKNYLASVSCASPTFTQASLNAGGIMVTSGSGQNLYNYSATNVISSANGTAPYSCAWDPTGSGIQDTAFHDCATVLSNVYDNYVGTRNVGVLVKDACNTTFSVSKSLNLAYVEPTKPGNVFIFGQILNAAGSVKGDTRIDGVNYLATNNGGNNIVQPSYGGGTFVIQAYQNYGMPSSVKFGMQIKVTGLEETTPINVSTGKGALSAAKAQIAAVSYTTDQNGDQSPQVSLSATVCTLSGQGASVKFIKGQPCSAGTTGDSNSATVEVYGHYSCVNTLGNATGTATIQGDFDGYAKMADNCSGGGGGGGGVAPINL